MHSRTRKISEWHVGLEAQFFVRANERELRLGSHCPVGRWGHLSRTPTGESALRWPHRPVPPQPRSREMSEFAWRLSDKYANFGKDTYQNLQIRIVSVQILIVSCLVNVGNLKMDVTTPKILTNRIGCGGKPKFQHSYRYRIILGNGQVFLGSRGFTRVYEVYEPDSYIRI